MTARWVVLFVLALAGCGASWSDEADALGMAARSNVFAAKYADGGLSSVFNRSAYCGIRGIEKRHGLDTTFDGGIPCPQ